MVATNPLKLTSYLCALGACTAAALVFFTGAYHGGFLSDDYALLGKVATIALGEPLEPHHYSLVRVALLKLAVAETLGPAALHVLAFLTHCLNSLLVLVVCHRALGMDNVAASFVTALFAFNPAGYEAIAWISAIGYVLVFAPILLGLLLVAASPFRPMITGLLLACLQLIALAIWDWGILLCPLAGVYFLLARMEWNVQGLRRGVTLFLPALLCLAAVLMLKINHGYSAGYKLGPDSLLLSAQYLLGSSLLALVPNGSLAFATSGPGIALCVLLVAVLLVAAVKSTACRTALVLCGICALPFVLFSAPASRYYYIASPFFYAAVVSALSLTKPRALGLAILALYTTVALLWSAERSQRWLNAYQQAERIRVEVKRQAPEGFFVLLNLPDSYGPKDYLFSPYVWRNGMGAFGVRFKRANTRDTAIPWPQERVPVLARSEVRREYPGLPVLEVRLEEGDWRSFEVVRWPAAQAP